MRHHHKRQLCMRRSIKSDLVSVSKNMHMLFTCKVVHLRHVQVTNVTVLSSISYEHNEFSHIAIN
ncbi:CLUMA_CG000437, isoform A [Clunio marinus]|uniref:CLUMA_CG000437, isoform A n=1 Tax=Clunio marinus TaxID=568069 RepID=A0A1J1HF57_9DIPT|nr:CLUMA_CG000437, isoform A [Clunio marinus]